MPVPAGSASVSDLIALPVPGGTDLMVSVRRPGRTPVTTVAGFSFQENVLNHWIRTSGEYGAVLDFDRAVRDPADPERLITASDSGDHLHPSDAGMAAMAAAVPLRIVRTR